MNPISIGIYKKNITFAKGNKKTLESSLKNQSSARGLSRAVITSRSKVAPRAGEYSRP